MMRLRKLTVLSLFALASTLGCSNSCSRSPSQRVYFISPKEGEVVSPSFEVKFGVEGMTVRPALEDLLEKTSGHHHILIDNEKGFIDEGQVVPTDEKNIHYGKGETETTLNLSPGKHKLSLQFANGAHLSYGKKMSATITVEVKE